jgi:hypothetical protein
MMNRHGVIIAGAFLTALAAGCSSTGTPMAADPDDKVYVTGSRLPVKGTAAQSVKTTTDRNTIEDIVRRPGATGGVTGAGGS